MAFIAQRLGAGLSSEPSSDPEGTPDPRGSFSGAEAKTCQTGSTPVRASTLNPSQYGLMTNGVEPKDKCLRTSFMGVM